jgi:hypothetical protein
MSKPITFEVQTPPGTMVLLAVPESCLCCPWVEESTATEEHLRAAGFRTPKDYDALAGEELKTALALDAERATVRALREQLNAAVLDRDKAERDLPMLRDRIAELLEILDRVKAEFDRVRGNE